MFTQKPFSNLDTKRIDTLLDFLKFIDAFKTIKRRSHLSNGEQESDADHTRHLALFVMIFKEDLPKDINYTRMLEIALVHDLPEIYAGDMFPFDESITDVKKHNEYQAAKKLFDQLPEDMKRKFMELFEEYEAGQTKEAQLVKAFDKIQPDMQNLVYGGENRKEQNLTAEILERFKKKHIGTEPLTEYLFYNILNEGIEKGRLK